MKRRLIFRLALVLVATLPVLAQRGPEHGQERGQDRPRANQGHVPPPPERRDNPQAKPEPERHVTGHVNTIHTLTKTTGMGTTGRTISAITLNMLSSTVVSNTLAHPTVTTSNASIP